MPSQTPTGKASKGSVAIHVSHGRLQLRFRFEGERKYISLGFADTPQNRKLAEMRAREIELDILSEHFDETLARYKPKKAATKELVEEITLKPTPTLLELWNQYTSYRASSVKETTQLYYESFEKLFEKVGAVPLMNALRVKEGLEKVTTVHQTKKTLMQLNAACKWAVKHGLVLVNPYEGMANEMPQYRYQVEPEPNAFTEEEREQVIEAFAQHQGNWNGRGYTGIRYSHYAPFVEFLFFNRVPPVGGGWTAVEKWHWFPNG